MKRSVLFSVALMLLLAATSAIAQTSSFTYQGRFTESGTPATGTYDMQFKLFDGAGTQIGATISNGVVQVSSGVFTVQLDYGAAAFSGADRFLEIGVRSAGSGDPYTVLAPRQQLTSAVYAIRAGTTTTADTATSAATATNATQLGGVAASQYVITTDPRLNDARTPTAGSANYIQNNPANKQTGGFNINGDGIATTLSADSVMAGDFYLGGARVLYAPGNFNIAVGAGAGSALSLGFANSFFGFQAGNANDNGTHNTFAGFQSGKSSKETGHNAFFGAFSGFENISGNANTFIGEDNGSQNISGSFNSFVGQGSGKGIIDTNFNTGIGFASGAFPSDQSTFIGARANATQSGLTNATAIGSNARVSQSNSLVLGSINIGPNPPPDTNVGIGTTAPNFRLTVKTATTSYGIVHTDGTVTVGTYVGGSTGGGWFGTKSNHSLSFFVNDGSPSMTIETGGTVKITTLGAAGSTQLCRNASNQISTCSSSLRYKTNIHPFAGGLAVLNRLRPITFDWKQGGMHDLGFGAEDIAAIEPLLVTRNEKGEVEGVKYDRISAVLVNAVQEQQQQIQMQAQELKDQQQQVLRQQSQLSQQQREIEDLKRLLRKQPRRTSPRGK